MQRVSIPSRLWYDNKEWDLTFPDRWAVHNLNPPGFEKPALTPEQIRAKVENPIEGPTLEDLAGEAAGGDRLRRHDPADAGQGSSAPRLDALHRAGMKKDQIRFLWLWGPTASTT